MTIFERIADVLGLCWSLFRLSMQIVYGGWKVSKLHKPIVTIFGGSRLEEGDEYFKQAHKLGKMLVENDISVLTGGGPGIMEAASCGAQIRKTGKGASIGIGVTDLGEGQNPCVDEYIELNYFFARKWLLTRYSRAFVVFPGGFGTLDELAEVLTLIQTKKMKQLNAPIILIGKEFWHEFIDWLEGEALKHGFIDPEHFALFTVTDNLHEAFCLIRDECKI